jgi:Spy/CpxP family protein refolding chaperone
VNERSTRAWFAIFVLVVFCTGAGAGIVFDRFLSRGPHPPGRGPGGPGQLPPPERLHDQLTQTLRLTTEQQAKLEAILRERGDRLQTLQHDVQSRFDGEQRELRAEIRKVLTADQQKQFDEWLKNWQPPIGGRGGPMGGRGGPPPPGGGPGDGPPPER